MGRDRVSECLRIVSPTPVLNGSYKTNPDHDSSECENIRFLAISSLAVQDLRCGPSWAVTLLR